MSNANDAAGRGAPRIVVRMPDELHEKLKTTAKAQHRSLTAQIVVMLERSLKVGEGEAA